MKSTTEESEFVDGKNQNSLSVPCGIIAEKNYAKRVGKS